MGGGCVRIRGCLPAADPALPRSALHARPDACARPSCSRRATVETLRSRGPTGPDPKRSAAQLARLEQALLQGAKANGFAPTCEPLSGSAW